ncbi:MAG: hypothetical protein R2811_15710 [Flavobacteriales bacterium]
MRGFFATCMLSLAYLLVLMPDAVRVPALVGHYLAHKDRAPDLSVADFLDLHYGNEDHGGNGDTPHEQLPFHHHHLVGDNCNPSAIAVSTTTLMEATVAIPRAHTGMQPAVLLPGYENGLIQPPRC